MNSEYINFLVYFESIFFGVMLVITNNLILCFCFFLVISPSLAFWLETMQKGEGQKENRYYSINNSDPLIFLHFYLLSWSRGQSQIPTRRGH